MSRAAEFAFPPEARIVARMKLTKWIAALLSAGIFLAAARGADDGQRASKPEVRREIVAVIDAQLGAFRTRDVRKAFRYASADFQAQWPLQNFAATVQNNYPEIWSNTRAEFGLVRDDGKTATVLVHVYGKDSDASYDYTLVKEEAGWRIGAVLRHAPKKADKA